MSWRLLFSLNCPSYWSFFKNRSTENASLSLFHLGHQLLAGSAQCGFKLNDILRERLRLLTFVADQTATSSINLGPNEGLVILLSEKPSSDLSPRPSKKNETRRQSITRSDEVTRCRKDKPGLERRRLGKSDLRITKVGIGTAPIGSTPEWKVYWGPQDEKSAIKTIKTAIDIGVNWIDTAPFYGWGRAEQIVGKAIKGRRDEVHIFTKCGTVPDGKGGWSEDLRPESIKEQLEESLYRLRTDRVDLYQFHDPDPRTPIEESWREMQDLIDEGKVRYGGLSNHSTKLIARALKVGAVASSQNQYNPLQRQAESELFPFCLEREISVLGWGSLSEGVLADNFDINKLDPRDFRRGQVYAQPQNHDKIQRIRQVFQQVANNHGGTMVHAVIAWELMHPALTGAIIGVRSQNEAREMIGGADLKLTPDDVSLIEHALAVWEKQPN